MINRSNVLKGVLPKVLEMKDISKKKLLETRDDLTKTSELTQRLNSVVNCEYQKSERAGVPACIAMSNSHYGNGSFGEPTISRASTSVGIGVVAFPLTCSPPYHLLAQVVRKTHPLPVSSWSRWSRP